MIYSVFIILFLNWKIGVSCSVWKFLFETVDDDMLKFGDDNYETRGINFDDDYYYSDVDDTQMDDDNDDDTFIPIYFTQYLRSSEDRRSKT